MELLKPLHHNYSDWYVVEPLPVIYGDGSPYTQEPDNVEYVVTSQDVILGIYPYKNSAMRAVRDFCEDGHHTVEVHRHEYYNNNLTEAEIIFEGGLNEEGEIEHA